MRERERGKEREGEKGIVRKREYSISVSEKKEKVY